MNTAAAIKSLRQCVRAEESMGCLERYTIKLTAREGRLIIDRIAYLEGQVKQLESKQDL